MAKRYMCGGGGGGGVAGSGPLPLDPVHERSSMAGKIMPAKL